MPRSVAIVFETDFSDRLRKLAFHTPVWLVDSVENKRAAEEAWHAAIEWPHITVTLFRPPAGQATMDEWQALLEQIGFQQRNVEAIDVIGSPLTNAARATLTAAGFARIEGTPKGFRAKR